MAKRRTGKYSVEGKPYRVKVLAPTSCMKCHRPIRRNAPAYGVRLDRSFFYYHIKCKPKEK